jgi:hypothetical protein
MFGNLLLLFAAAAAAAAAAGLQVSLPAYAILNF